VATIRGLKTFGKIHPVWIIGRITETEKSRCQNGQEDNESDGKIDIAKETAEGHPVFPTLFFVLFLMLFLMPFPICNLKSEICNGFGRYS
jgi:hypothetical protein